MRSWLSASLLLSPVFLLAGCPDEPLLCPGVLIASVSGVVVDQNQAPVPIRSVTLRQGKSAWACSVESTSPNSYACYASKPGRVTVEVVAAGRTLTAEATLVSTWGACQVEAEEPLNFVWDGPVCPPATAAVAVRGTVRDAEGNPAMLQEVGIEITDSHRSYAEPLDQTWCTVDGNAYECPALSPYEASYTVYFRDSDSELDFFTQEVTVSAPGCEPSTNSSTWTAQISVVRPPWSPRSWAR